MINSKLPAFYYGGDYNPDQWPEETWEEDMRLFKNAGINIITVPVFSWAKLEPSEGIYDFSWLDKIMDLAHKNNIFVCLATSTAAQPAWMSKKYPEILPVDQNLRKKVHGGRVNFCPNSKLFKKFSVNLASKLAEHYKDHPALVIWHIGNEYGNYCYCENCENEFRLWLKKRYGTTEELNRAWNMSFWGHTIYDWEEIVVPSELNSDKYSFQGMSLDYNRFMSDSSLECYYGEYKAIKAITPAIKITTNLMGTFKPLDYFKWAEKMDVISWDSYPRLTDPASTTALRHDLMRGLKNGAPFMLMEQTPSQQNWQPYNSLKRPGVMRLQSYQAIAHGSDTVMFFQLRRSFGAGEKYHGALIAHSGSDKTRVYKECAVLGDELKILGDSIIDSTLKAKVGIIFDWDNWWAIEMSSGPTILLKYLDQIEKYYKPFFDMNIPVDLISPVSDLSKYDIIIAPVLYMVKPGVSKNIESFVKHGGTFITTFFSGIVNENDLVTLGGYPGELRPLLGIFVEEIDALFPDMKNSIVMEAVLGELKGTYDCDMLCDLLELEGAKALATYGSDFYKGKPVITVNNFGKGKAYYVASNPSEDFVLSLMKYISKEKAIYSPDIDGTLPVEITTRFNGPSEFTFILNHNTEACTINLKNNSYENMLTGEKMDNIFNIEAKGVNILKKI
ncbi:MAG TPA: beta-galactosidase [Clostridiaceae bacterium]